MFLIELLEVRLKLPGRDKKDSVSTSGIVNIKARL